MRMFQMKRCSVYIVSATATSLAVLALALALYIIELKRGTLDEIYNGEQPQRTIAVLFHVWSFLFMAVVFMYHLDKCIKRSYGFQTLEKNQLSIFGTGFVAICFFLASIVSTIMNMNYVLAIGAFLLLDSVAFMLLCVFHTKRREKIENFMESVLSINRSDGLPLTEQHALDLFRLQACDADFVAALHQKRCRFELQSVRIVEYYYLQRWCAELERLKQAEGAEMKAHRVDCLLKEMEERAHVFGLGPFEAVRWRELASFPHITMPEDVCRSDWDEESAERNYSARPFLVKSPHFALTNGLCSR